MTVSGEKSDFDAGSLAELMESLRPALPFLEKIVAYGRHRYGESTTPSPDQKTIEITFTNTELIVNGRHISKDAPFLLSEYVILKQNVHWLWAFIILPQFDARNPDYQFRNYIAKRRKELEDYGIYVDTVKKKGTNGKAIFKKIEDYVASNIKNILAKSHEAQDIYKTDPGQAVETLSCITKDKDNTWFTFTDAYTTLATWICELNFKDISENLIKRCQLFLTQYARQLKLGISRIEQYQKLNGLSQESTEVFEAIKTDLEKAEKLYAALVNCVALDPKEKAYLDFSNLLVQVHECLLSIHEKTRDQEIVENDSIDIIKRLVQSNEHIYEIIDSGYDVLDRIFEAKRQRHKFNNEEIEDMREDILWYVAEILLATTNFDEFDKRGGNKLECLKHHLRFCLQQRIKRRIEGTQS
jgi:hypothetical protein